MNKKGQAAIGIGDAPTVVMIVGFVFLMMATVAYIGEEYGDAITDDGTTNGSHAHNVTLSLQKELADNTSIAGIVLTISLVGIVLSVLIGIFVASRRGGL